MTEKRIQFNTIVQNQLPAYVREDFPLISEFLKQYYLSQEFQGAPTDIIQNIDRYIKLNETTGFPESVILRSDLSYEDTTIFVDLIQSPKGTSGFPDSYGLLKIDNEIITYTGKTNNSFTGCVRGFSGITDYTNDNNPDELVFSTSVADLHKGTNYGSRGAVISMGAKIENLSILFLKEFLLKTKNQFLPGLENRNLSSKLNQNVFIKQAKDFYSTRGTDRSFEILFRALYNEDVKIVRPSEYLLTPSYANYEVVRDLIVESIEGDPLDLENSVLFQDEYRGIFSKAYAPITSVEKIITGIGQTYYRMSFDSGYNKDLIVDGALYGGFLVHPKTRVIGQVSAGSTIIDVDSTVGFGTTGEIQVRFSDDTFGVISYASRTLTQFYGCTGIGKTILDKSSVGINTYAYGKYYSFSNVGASSTVRSEKIVKIRINNVISNIDYEDDTINSSIGDSIIVKTLGSRSRDYVSKNWFYNVASKYQVDSISLLDSSTNTYRLNLKTNHYFRSGDKITITGSDKIEKDSTIIEILSEKSLMIRDQGSLSLTDSYFIKRRILKGQSSAHPGIRNFSANVQNVYTKKAETSETEIPSKILVASNSIPYYTDQPLESKDGSVTLSGTFSGQNLTIPNHGFWTGDAVYYTPQKTSTTTVNSDGQQIVITNVLSSLFTEGSNGLYGEGLYYVKKVDDNTIKLARNRSNIYNSIFLSFDSVSVSNNKLQPYDFKLKTVKPQKLLREISTPILDGNIYETEPGFNGILVNGVEILNYKSTEEIYYGKISEIEVTAPGSSYDIVNPPLLKISDSVGSGATGNVSVSGSLQEIRILDPGFDYVETPNVVISGGNGSGADVSVTMKDINHEALFFAGASSNKVGLGSTQSTIGFSTYHKFRNGEQVIYDTFSQRSVGGLSTYSSYFVSYVNDLTVKLHRNQSDAISGINTITLTSYGIGEHKLKSFTKKLVVDRINVISGGSGYENKRRSISSSGISTHTNQININNHDYKSGEIVVYNCEGTPVSGLTTNTEYYVTRIDNNKFRLSNVGVSSDKDFYYRTNQYVNLTSIGSGTHTFNYPQINVSLFGKIGISSIGTKTFEAEIQPVFRGSITSVNLSNQGVGYGSSEIINFEREPLVTLVSGSSAQLQPVVNDGKITEVLVLNPGVNYNSIPDLILTGNGTGAVLTPVISNGQLTSVRVVQTGTGYDPASTFVTVSTPGSGAEFKTRLQRWKINLFQKNFNNFTNDDGFIAESINQSNELQYCHLYAPRKLRESVFSLDQSGKTIFGSKDLTRVSNVEITSKNHSPIIGWAYDGHPIYGPYGYSTKSGGIVKQMRSGYTLNSSRQSGPPTSIYPLGFFIEDYTYNNVSDDSVLDENNGRFCVTPEFPKGTYAYFATFDTLSVDTSPPFLNYKRPVFPYLIGNNFKGAPNKFNYVYSSNQDDYDINSTDWLRNTDPYNLINGTLRYDYLNIPNDLNQKSEITAILPGGINGVGIITGGNGYKVNDSAVFSNGNTSGSGAIAKVSKLLGKSVNSISVATSSITGVEIYPSNNLGEYVVICDNPHNFKNGDTVNVTGLSTTSSKIEGSYSVGVGTTATISLVGFGTTSSGVGTAGATGIVTYFYVGGTLSNLRENDILNVGREKVKILNVDQQLSRIRVLRSINGISSSHPATTVLYEDPRKLIVNPGFKTTYSYRENKQIYFNPLESVGLGTISGVGIGTTIFLSNPGAGITQIFIPTKTIYLKNHKLETGDEVTYSSNGGSGLIVVDQSNVGVGTTLTSGQKLFVAKINDDLIGLSTVKVGLGTTGTFVGIASTVRSSTTLYFSGIGTGVYHSLKTNYQVITGEINRNLVTVSVAQTHGLKQNDYVYVDVNPGVSTTFIIKYSDFARKTLLNPQTFLSSGINTSSSTITINNHGLKTGQKVLYTSATPSQGLTNNFEYFIVKVDDNNLKFANSYYDSTSSKPPIVGISSASDGTISLINPPIEIYRDSTVSFDLSDHSLSHTVQSIKYPAFEFNFYLDENFTQIYDKTLTSKSFEVQKVGTVGVSSDAKVILKVDKNTPNTLFYRLDPVYDNSLPDTKSQISQDNEVVLNNRIIPRYSLYNGKYNVEIPSPTSFTYSLSKKPENDSYISTTSSAVISYETDSINAYGPISEVKVKDFGKNYTSLPGITTVTSDLGKGAVLEPFSSTIGKIKRVKINDIGFDFSSDNTVRPSSAIPQVIKIESLSSFKSIGITSVGVGYNKAPKLLVFDGKTNALIKDVDLRYDLGDSNVTIFKNTYGITNIKPTILPVQNTNGVGIGSIFYNQSTKDVTVTLAVGFSTANIFPFSVNDKVLIENVSVGLGSTGKGFNSENYNYTLFTLKSVDENRGGIGSVTYSLSGIIGDGEIVGKFDSANSSGRIIPQKHFPIFDPILKTNDYFKGEVVKSTSSSTSGIVESWDSNNSILKISSKENFIVGEVIEGMSSKSQGISSSILNFESRFTVSPTAKVERGWQNIYGFLNDNLQRIQDSFYYQKFSYSLKSRVDFNTWDNVVSSLNHTLGFKKFSDYQMESSSQNNMNVGLSTDVGYFEAITDLTRFINLNCVFDFDLVKENSINFGNGIISDEIIFANRVLTDYEESIGNRVLSIDDLSSLFNSNPRSTAFSVVNTFSLSNTRAQKYITFVTDKRFTAQRQLLLVDLIHDGAFAYINQYGRVETTYDQGSFDFSISGTEGQLLFYPTKYTVNDYNVTCLSYNIDDNLLGTGSTSIGGIALIDTDSVSLSPTPTTIVGIASTYSSVKVLVEITPDINYNEFEFTELNLVHDGTNIELLEYGQLKTSPTSYSTSGLGTYHPYFNGSNLNIDFIPNSGVGIGTTGVINIIQVGLANSSYSGIGTLDLKHARIEARATTIASSGSPGIHTIASYPNDYDAAYFIVQAVDKTNNDYQLSEVIVVDDYVDTSTSYDTYDTEFGIIQTSSGIGTIGSRISSNGTVELTFVPNPSIDVEVKVYMNALRHQDDSRDIINFNNGTIETFFSDYTGTERDIKRSFELKHKTYPIFERYFDGSSSSIVSVDSNSITIPNHFFVTGENVVYYQSGAGTTQAIGIATTTLTGVGSTDKLTPGITTSLYVVKINENTIKLASSAENALKVVPQVLDITSVGIGTSHRFVSRNQNAKVIVSLDNIIQSPVVSTAVTTTLASQVFTTDDVLKFSGITSFFGSDLIRINDEILKIEGVGIGSTNTVRVRREWLGTKLSGYSTGTLVTKITGNYNIVDNILTFSEAPYGNTPLGTSTNPPDERDWSGISTSSYFHGRSFMRSGVLNTSNETYYKNYVLNDISSEFDGNRDIFRLKSNGSNVSGISTENAIILINDVFQGPGISYDYTLSENAGITSITFTGTATSITSDVNTSSRPVGGVIVSVGSTEGFGYQPLVSAGGTAIVSFAGTIQSISIANTGSGYRSSDEYEILTKTSSTIGVGSTSIYLNNQNSVFAILNLLKNGSNCTIGIGTFIASAPIISIASTFVQIGIGSTSSHEIPIDTSVSVNITNPQIGVVNVSVANSSVGVGTITHVGFATVINGNISTSITLTNPGSGYTTSNPPFVIADAPKSYSDIKLNYSSSSVSGFGTGATIDIVVGQGSSVIDFEVKNTGYGYRVGEILTIPTGGLVGIPTSSGFKEFQVSIQNVFTDEFTGWSIGELEVFDSFDALFDGETRAFQLKKGGTIKSIVAAKGSNIVVQDTLLVFINDILQVPGEGYTFTGGSILTFTEAPKGPSADGNFSGDTSKIIFYKGSGSVDVVSREILETVKVGDELTIGYDPSVGQKPDLQEGERTVTKINSTDSVDTDPYYGPGNTENETLLRPVVWCRQTEDKIINGKEVSKDRELYEPNINHFAYLIKNVGIGSTVIYVDNVRPFFNPKNENDITLDFQNSITLISQNERSGAIGTAIVSGLGTISSVSISDGGVGYTTATVSFGSTVGVGTTTSAFGSVIIGAAGTVTGIAITSPGYGYTSSNPPQVLISLPTSTVETNSVSNFYGDSGIIVGFGTTTSGSDLQVVFDLHVPKDSFMRDGSLVGTAVTLSQISANDYFIVYGSNIGVGSTSITSKDNAGNSIGIGTRFVDNVYQVKSVSNAESNIIGIGSTVVRRINATVVGFGITTGGIYTTSNYLGNYSWGKIELNARSEANQFNFYGDNGIGGITTSTIVQRTKSLRFKNYLI